MKLLRFFLFLYFFTFIFLYFPLSKAHALENFVTDYNVTYTVGEDGVTTALLKIDLTNLNSGLYASSYKVDVGFSDIYDIKSADPDGPIVPVLEKTQDGKAISVTFNKKVVGKEKTLSFTVSFKTREIAKKQGRIWEINIPGVMDENDLPAGRQGFSSFDVAVKVPPSFGSPAYIKPSTGTNNLKFTKEMLGESGISLSFGTEQTYNFDLTYHIGNKNIFPIRTEIALPPSTNYQEIAITSLEPKPEDVFVDPDGNWLATYYLLPTQKIDVKARGQAIISLLPKKQTLTENDRKKYLSPDIYWQTTDPSIQKLALTLKTPEKIYDYVVKSLKYDFQRVTKGAPRLGAAKVLSSPSSAVCLEFTDLFIALARAAGVPAREVNGFAYTQNTRQRPLSLVKDILHAWPEYYDKDKQTWVMIDPTWGNTTGSTDYFHTLDFDHFTFVIKGLQSQYPIPAGGYKLPGDEKKKDINVSFGDTESLLLQKFSYTNHMKKEYLSELPLSSTITITNTGHVAIKPLQMKITTQSISPMSQTVTTPLIPPYGSGIVSYRFDQTPFLTNKTEAITISLADKKFVEKIKISPLLLSQRDIYGGIIIGILTIIILIFAYTARRLPFSRRK